MSRVLVGLAGACVVLAVAGSADAAGLLQFTMQGTITAQSPPHTVPGVDPNDYEPIPVDIHVGDTVTLSARFSPSRLLASGSGYVVPLEYILRTDCDPDGSCSGTAIPGLPASGAQYFRVQVDGLTYPADFEIGDGFPLLETQLTGPNGHTITLDYGFPVLSFDASGRFLNLAGQFEPGEPMPIPNLHSSGPTFVFDNLGTFNFNPNMSVFSGVWDVAGASLSAVPEPASWGLGVIGLAAAGASLRWRRRSASALKA